MRGNAADDFHFAEAAGFEDDGCAGERAADGCCLGDAGFELAMEIQGANAQSSADEHGCVSAGHEQAAELIGGERRCCCADVGCGGDTQCDRDYDHFASGFEV